jgi:two-component system invasion response regulator UvrY
MKTNILLVDDHAIVRQGYRSLIDDHRDLKVINEAASGEDAYRLYQKEPADLVVMDLSLPGKGGLATLIQLLQYDRGAKILVFSMHQDPHTATKLLQAGARGYISKSSDPECLIDAIYKIMHGDIVLSDDIKEALALSSLNNSPNGVTKLSAREYQILGFLLEGKNKAEISDLLCISQKTVSNCHYIIKRKLGVNNDIELVNEAAKLGLFKEG